MRFTLTLQHPVTWYGACAMPTGPNADGFLPISSVFAPLYSSTGCRDWLQTFRSSSWNILTRGRKTCDCWKTTSYSACSESDSLHQALREWSALAGAGWVGGLAGWVVQTTRLWNLLACRSKTVAKRVVAAAGLPGRSSAVTWFRLRICWVWFVVLCHYTINKWPVGLCTIINCTAYIKYHSDV